MKYINKTIHFFIVSLLLGCGSGSSGGKISDSNVSEVIYSIGHKSVSFQDSQQTSYPITAELFYPSSLDREQNTIANNDFPLIVFAHGYQQVYSDYHHIWEALVPKGYILAFLTTQQGLSINIDTYADDIVLLYNELRHASDSIITGHLTDQSALMGHSTGGGAIYLAQQKLPQNTTLISLAALGTVYGPIFGTSPIDIAQTITAPSLVLSGNQDCITPVHTHQEPLFNALLGDKTMVNILGGDHCGFSDSFNCPAAESLSCALFFQGTTISETEQRTLSLELITPWLEYYLKDKPDAWLRFVSLQESDLLNYE